MYSERESSPPVLSDPDPPFPAVSPAPELKEPRVSIVWEEASLWPSTEKGSSGGSGLTAELKNGVVSWPEEAGMPGEYGGLNPTAVFGKLVGMAPWTGFWWRKVNIRYFYTDQSSIEWKRPIVPPCSSQLHSPRWPQHLWEYFPARYPDTMCPHSSHILPCVQIQAQSMAPALTAPDLGFLACPGAQQGSVRESAGHHWLGLVWPEGQGCIGHLLSLWDKQMNKLTHLFIYV